MKRHQGLRGRDRIRAAQIELAWTHEAFPKGQFDWTKSVKVNETNQISVRRHGLCIAAQLNWTGADKWRKDVCIAF